MELLEVTPDPASESSNPLFEPGTDVLIKTLGSRGQSLEPLWKGLNPVTLLPQPSKELIHGSITLELRDGALTRTKKFHVFTFCALTL